jgi:hypothetical protein
MNTMQLRSALHRASGGLAGLLMAIVLMSPSSLRAQPSEEARYTMMFRSVDLHEALERVVETTHINLVYDSELVQGKTVYCSARDVRPDALLRCLLVNVPVDFYQTSGGTYVLKESPQRPPRRGDLAGIVVDGKTGEPLPYAHVLLAAANTGVASDQVGRFQLPNLISGTYRVVATHLGYEPAVDSIYVPPGDSVRRRITLTPTPIVSTPVIVDGVERRAPEGKVGAATLSADELAESGRLGTPDALGRAGTLMGVSRQRPMADLHVQGGAAGEHQVRLDGMPIRNPVTLRRLLGAFSPLALDRLTVRKAGFGVEHGSTISGVVSAEHALSASAPSVGQVTIDPMSVNAEGHGSVDLGDRRTAQFRVAARSSVWDLYRNPTLNRLLLDWNVADPMLLASYFDESEVPDIEPAAQTAGVGFSDLHAAARVDLGPYRSLSVSSYRGRNHLRTQFVARDPFGMLTQDRYDWANTAGQARLDWTLGARSSASVQLRASEHRVHRGYQMTYGSPDPDADIAAAVDTLQRALNPALWPDDQNRIREWTLETTGSYAAATRHHLKGAVEVSRLTSEFRLGGRFLRPLSFRDTRWQVGGYLRDVASLGTNTTLTAGTRFTYVPARRTLYAEPRLSLHQEGAVAGLGPYTVRLAGGLYRQFVNRFEASSTSPTATLPSMRFWMPVGQTHAPPRAYHATVDAQFQPRERWTVAGEVYYKHYARLLTLDYTALHDGDTAPLAASEAVSPTSAITPTQGRAAGAGLALTREGPRVEGTLHYNWSRSRRRFPGRFEGHVVPVPWNQPHRLSLSAEGTFTDALRLRLRAEHSWGRSWGFRQIYYDYLGTESAPESSLGGSLQNPGSHTLTPHTRVDLGVRYTVQWSGFALETQLDLVNVLDHRDAFDWGLRPTDDGMTRTTRRLPGRRLVGALTIRY